MNKSIEIAKAIKQGCWLQIQYNNTERDTYFWIAINDLDAKRKIIYCDLYNENGNVSGSVYFDKIIYAKVVRNSYYDVPETLMAKIAKDPESFDWLDFEDRTVDLLEYYRECYYNDIDASVKEFDMIEGIDNDVLNNSLHNSESGKYTMTLGQLGELKKMLGLKMTLKDEEELDIRDLGLNIFSLSSKDTVYNVAYKLVRFNPKDCTLKLDNRIIFNNALNIKGKKISFTSLIDYPEFVELRNYVLKQDESSEVKELSEELKTAIQKKVGSNVKQDERPYLIILGRDIKVPITNELNSMIEMHKNQSLTVPLKAFFGTINSKNIRRKNHPIALYDNNVNVDQLRVINNAMKNPVTYVEGPPGTGKTYTILNILVSAFYNGRTVLITSNNNKPVDDIYRKIKALKYNDEMIPFPIIRLGNNKVTGDTLKIIKEHYIKFKDEKMPIINFKSIKENTEKDLKELNRLLDEDEKRLMLEGQLDYTIGFLEELSATGSIRTLEFELRKQELEKKLSEQKELTNEDILKYVVINKDFSEWLYYRAISYIQRLREPKYEKLREVLNMDLDNEDILKTAVKSFNEYIRSDDGLKDFLRVYPLVVTTNLSAVKLGSAKVQFDLVIMDEAGQCSIAASFPPLVRGESLVLVGDENQLNPVIVLDEELNKILKYQYNIGSHYDYCCNSILSTMADIDAVSMYLMLKKHYRSVKDIIAFSNRKYYGEQLEYARTSSSSREPLQIIQVTSSKNDIVEKNTTAKEAEAIISAIKSNNLKNVGIITPFKNQSELIKSMAEENGLKDFVEIGTIHSFQGGEKDAIFISLAVTPYTKDGTFNWVRNNKELINVGVTRAMNNLILVGDIIEVEKRSKKENNDLNELAQYMKSKGKSMVLNSTNKNVKSRYSGLKRLNSPAEKELLQTLVQIMSIDDKYKVESKVKVSSVLSDEDVTDMQYYLQSEFDFVIYDKNDYPVLVIELNGLEHETDERVKLRDQKKGMLARNKIKLFPISNDFTRKYQFIKNYITTIINDK